MSKSSHSKRRKPAPKRPPTKHNQSPRRRQQSKSTPVQVATKERNLALTLAIIYVMIHGLLLLGIVISENGLPTWAARPVLVGTVAVTAVADIIAGIMLWQWKRLGLTLYLIATLAVMTVGILFTGSSLFLFSAILPFAIVGYIVRMNWSQFE